MAYDPIKAAKQQEKNETKATLWVIAIFVLAILTGTAEIVAPLFIIGYIWYMYKNRPQR